LPVTRSVDHYALAVIERDVADVIRHLGPKLDLLSGATILVTGASGMLGGYLADVAAALNPLGVLSSSCTVFLATRERPRVEGRLGHLLGRSDVQFIVGNALDTGDLPARANVILHAASPASPKHYLADPVGTLDANSRYLRILLELARHSDARAFLYISSSEIYGDPPDDAIPTAETYVGRVDPGSPRSCYAEGKRFGEALCMAFRRQHDLPVNIIRPFHIHGPGLRLDDGRIIADLIRAGLAGASFTLSSDGTATRCYGYVSDAVAGAYAAMLSDHPGEAFNIGVDGPETSILELAVVVAELMGAPPPRASLAPLPPHLVNAPRRSCPDLSKARTLLGYSPRVTLRDGLRRTVAWHQAQRSLRG
jgi:UDP-glucuronate decarboxylase